MKYLFKSANIDANSILEISKDDYERLIDARRRIIENIAIEQKFDILMSNYAEFEDDFLSQITESVIFSEGSETQLRHNMAKLSRRVVNLLTSCRLYSDHVVHHLRVMFGEGTQQEIQFEALKSNKYDEYLEYRTFEKLRNYVQHRGLPIHGYTASSKLMASRPDGIRRNTMTPYILTSELRSDKKFNKTVLNELERRGDKVNIVKYIRVYIDCICDIHHSLRSNLLTLLANDQDIFVQSIENFERDHNGMKRAAGLCLYKCDGDKVLSKDYFIRDPLELTKFYVSRNNYRPYVASNYVSSEINED